MSRTPLPATRAGLIASDRIRPAGDPSAPYWHHTPATLRLDTLGNSRARTHIAQGPIRVHVPRP